MTNNTKLYKFRPLANCKDLERIKGIIKNGFYCCDFLNFNDMNEGVFSINQKNIEITLDQKQQYKICSFSGKNTLNSELMWGHYANAGMGVAIEVEVDITNDTNIEEVDYSNKTSNSSNIKKILTKKSKEWSYEKEHRYISENCCDKIYKDGITKIYFGMPYKELKNYEDIIGKHKKLEKYLELKEKLENYIKDTNANVDVEGYKFAKVEWVRGHKHIN